MPTPTLMGTIMYFGKGLMLLSGQPQVFVLISSAKLDGQENRSHLWMVLLVLILFCVFSRWLCALLGMIIVGISILCVSNR